MRAFCDFRVLPELKLVVEYCSEELTIEDAMALKVREAKSRAFDPTYNIITDLRDSDVVVAEDEVDGFIDFLQNYQGLAGKRRTALITRTPSQVILSSLMKYAASGLPIHFEVFSTLEAGMHFVGANDQSQGSIEAAIAEMKR